MGKVVMPKNSALLNEVEAVLKIYYEAGTWLDNEEYKRRLKNIIGDDQYASSYTKKAQITSYFGFTEWEDISDVRSKRRITESGKEFYLNIKNNNEAGIKQSILESLENVTFGRNNYGCIESDSDIEPPCLFTRASLDLNGLSYKEFAYLIWSLDDKGKTYTDCIRELSNYRKNNQSIILQADAQKYTDAKPIMVMLRWGFFTEQNGLIYVANDLKRKYLERLNNLKIYNVDKITSKTKYLSPEWFHEKGQSLLDYDLEAKTFYDFFQTNFGKSKLESLDGEPLLTTLFLCGNKTNMSYLLEYDSNYRRLFGSVKGGNAYKYPLHIDNKTGSWVTGTKNNPIILTLEQAIEKGKHIRDLLVAILDIVSSYSNELNSVEDYLDLSKKLYDSAAEILDNIWLSKYLHLMFPDKFSVFHNREWQDKILSIINDTTDDRTFCRIGKIELFVKKCEISNVVFSQVVYKYCNNNQNTDIPENSNLITNNLDFDPEEFSCCGVNVILYGVPGSGKSFTIKNDYIGSSKATSLRIVFHQDYTYSDFVGQIRPVIENGQAKYDFVPGPFTNILKMAYSNPSQKFYLVIEEINRGNSASIFGDIFQLLDREDDPSNRFYQWSKYSIYNENIAKIIFDDSKHEIKIPSNLGLLASMNTSDQNVFTLDTAFQRRWDLRQISNTFDKTILENKELAEQKILDTDVTWERFISEINKAILENNVGLTSAEDKRLGTHFLLKNDLILEDPNEDGISVEEQISRRLHNRKFAEKVIKYLWDDAFKFNRNKAFTTIYKDLESLINAFMTAHNNKRFDIFVENIREALKGEKDNSQDTNPTENGNE